MDHTQIVERLRALIAQWRDEAERIAELSRVCGCIHPDRDRLVLCAQQLNALLAALRPAEDR